MQEKTKNKSFWVDLQKVCKEGKLMTYLSSSDHATLQATSEILTSKGEFELLKPETFFDTFLREAYVCEKLQEFKNFKRLPTHKNMWFSQLDTFPEHVLFQNNAARKLGKVKRENRKRKMIAGNDKDLRIFDLEAENETLKKQLNPLVHVVAFSQQPCLSSH